MPVQLKTYSKNITRTKEIASTPVGIIPPAIDKGLQMLAIFHLCFIFLAHITVTLRFSRIKLGEVPRFVSQRQG